jgi:hypothetical protein
MRTNAQVRCHRVKERRGRHIFLRVSRLPPRRMVLSSRGATRCRREPQVVGVRALASVAEEGMFR